MTSIRETIASALPSDVAGEYPSYVNAVVTALTEREQTLTESAINLVDSRHGYDYAETAKELLAEVGFEIKPEPQPEPEADPAAEADPEAPVTRAEFNSFRSLVENIAKTLGVNVHE